MLIKPVKYMRKPFFVEAVEVTAENIAEVAQWCHGSLRQSAGPGGRRPQKYIKVNVKRPLTPRQTMAYVGDWVVTASDQTIRGFKVYTPRAFEQSFDAVVEDMFKTLERMEERAQAEDRAEEQEETLFPEELQLAYRQAP